MLKPFARHLLLLVVLLGLANQGFAREIAPCKAMSQAETTAMQDMADMPCCDEMQHGGKGKAPDKAASPCCYAMANGSVGIASEAKPQLGSLILPPVLAATWPAMPALYGREITPDPDPPSYPA